MIFKDRRFKRTKEELIQEIKTLKVRQQGCYEVNSKYMTKPCVLKYWNEAQVEIDRLEKKLQGAS